LLYFALVLLLVAGMLALSFVFGQRHQDRATGSLPSRECVGGIDYALGLREATVIAMADEFSQATKKPVLVNLHTSPGLDNVMTAYENETRSSSRQVTRPGDNPCRC
jgi:hypothetical protein